jgi:Na+(H+)/acetate symporter ActP
VSVDEIVALAVGVAAALSFPIVVVAVHGRRERRRNRKMGTRRNDKIRLTGDE